MVSEKRKEQMREYSRARRKSEEGKKYSREYMEKYKENNAEKIREWNKEAQRRWRERQKQIKLNEWMNVSDPIIEI